MEAKILNYIMPFLGDIFYDNDHLILEIIKDKEYKILKFLINKKLLDYITIIDEALKLKSYDFIEKFIIFCDKDFVISFFGNSDYENYPIFNENRDLLIKHLDRIPEGQTKSILDLAYDELVERKSAKSLEEIHNLSTQGFEPNNEITRTNVMKVIDDELAQSDIIR